MLLRTALCLLACTCAVSLSAKPDTTAMSADWHRLAAPFRVLHDAFTAADTITDADEAAARRQILAMLGECGDDPYAHACTQRLFSAMDFAGRLRSRGAFLAEVGGLRVPPGRHQRLR